MHSLSAPAPDAKFSAILNLLLGLMMMNEPLRLHDLVVMLEDTPTAHFEDGHPLMLRPGQIETIVMAYEGDVFEVEFADANGCAYTY